MRISKRELFLLFILGLVGIVGLMIAFVIMPLQADNDARDLTLAELRNEKAAYDSLMPVLEANKLQLEKRVQEVGKLMNDTIMTPLNEAEFDQWVDPLLKKYSMKLVDANFEEPLVVTPAALELLYADPIYDIKTQVDSIHGKVEVFSSQPTTAAELLMSVHTYKIKSSYESYRSFLDEVSAWNTSVYVVLSTYDFVEGVAVVRFNVYMMEKLIPETNPKTYQVLQ